MLELTYMKDEQRSGQHNPTALPMLDPCRPCQTQDCRVFSVVFLRHLTLSSETHCVSFASEDPENTTLQRGHRRKKNVRTDAANDIETLQHQTTPTNTHTPAPPHTNIIL